MATSNRCSVCHKELGAIFCPGCDAYFCMKDFRGHRVNLFAKLDGIIGERNCLQEKIDKTTRHPNSPSSFIARIDEWQKNMIKKVEQMAEQARQHVTELLGSERVKVVIEFKTFSEELARLKESENFVEHDLIRLQHLVRQFDEELKQLSDASTIELHTEQSDRIKWDRLIYIEAKPSNTILQQQHQKATEEQQPAKSISQKSLRKNDSFQNLI